MTVQEQSQSAPSIAVSPNPAQKLIALYHSERFRQSVRVSLAMVIAYYVSLAMGWDRPHWAGLAVAVCSLGTVGDSLNKGMLRVLGTFAAGVVAILLGVLFPQDRWLYLLSATLYMSFAAYMMGKSTRQYFWFIAGYVVALLALAGGPEGATLFETIILRLQQTTMGVVVYFLVATILWPQKAAPHLIQTVSGLVDAQRRLISSCIGRLAGSPESGKVPELRGQIARTTAGLPALLDGAELDSFDVWELRHLWRHCTADLAALHEAMERWRQGFPDLERLDLQSLMPGLSAAGAELDARLADIGRMFAGVPPDRSPQEISLDLTMAALEPFSQFDRAAVLRSRDQLERIDKLTRALFDTIADIRDFGVSRRRVHPAAPPASVWTLDLDLLAGSVRTFVAVWIVLLACIYVPGIPMPAGVIPITAAVAIQLVLMPQASMLPIAAVAVVIMIFGGAFQIFLMPQLSSFVGLAIGIFVYIFLINFVLAKPQQAVARALGMTFFVMTILVKNEQTYSLLYVLNFGLAILLGLSAVGLSRWFPFSSRPQQVVSRHLHRFLTSSGRLIATMRDDSRGWLRRQLAAFDAHQVKTLPGNTGRWIAALPAVKEGRVPRDRLQALVDSLQRLSDRIKELVELRGLEHAEAIKGELLGDVRAWRLGIQEVLHALAVDPASVEAGALRARVDAKLAAVETRIERTLNALPPGSASSEQLQNMYRLLGAYRGVSEALVTAVQCASQIDWRKVAEARF